jgi:hypothetical protein
MASIANGCTENGTYMLLTAHEISALLESLQYSIRRIEDYPHQELSHKQTSLEPLLSAKDKLQRHKYEIKTSTK